MHYLALPLVVGLITQGGSQVRGRVTDVHTNAPVNAAIVQLTGPRILRQAFTDSKGEYVFVGVPDGTFRLQVTHPGFQMANLEIVLAGGRGVELDVPLTVRPIPGPRLSVVVAQGSRVVNDEADGAAAAAALPSSNSRLLGIGPQSASALSDMVAARAASQPPDRQGGDGSHVLYVFGAGVDQGRVLLDGATLNAPLHLGGMIAPIDPELLARAEPRSAGASPRFDGGTTQVLELVTRPARGDAFHGWAEIDPLTSRVGFESPVSNGRFLVGGRRINSGIIEQLTGRPLGYGYADGLVRADWQPSADDRVSVTGFASGESVLIPRDFETDRADWQNLAGAASWVRTRGDREHTLALSYGRAIADLPLLSAPGAHGESDIQRIALNAEQWRRGDRTTTTIGIEVERLSFLRRTTSPSSFSPCAGASSCTDETMAVVSPWAQLIVDAAPGLRLSGGLRLAYNAQLGRLDPLPRATLTKLVGDASALTLSAGRFSRATVVIPGIGPTLQGPGSSGDPPEEAHVAVARATHVEVSLARRTASSALGASIFARRHHSVATIGAHTTPGADLWLARNVAWGNVTVGYSFARLRGAGPDDSRDRHVVATSASGLAGPFKVHVSGAYARGLPFVSVVLDDPDRDTSPLLFDVAGSVPEERAPPQGEYVRLDASVSAAWSLNGFGRSIALTPYIKVMNALGRRDGLFYFREAGPDGRIRALATMPLVPALGARVSF